ncbi:MAG: 3'-5' exonuclease, partial [Phototrophicaceae bacterium]
AFDPEQHRGKVTVSTMHRAKGLEWDRVYLMSVNNYDFPSAEPQDSFFEERWWVRDKLNLQAEALEQLASVYEDRSYDEGVATGAARIDYAAERLRLLYVGITRAREELVITWNSGRQGNNYPATPLVALQHYWDQRQQSPPEPPKKKPARRKKREKKS